jgi:hypothetical protein
MAEVTSNVEFAHQIHEQGHSGGGPHSRRAEWLEVLEAVALAAVAVLTAWSGYQAARWDAKSGEEYAIASATTVRGQEQQTLAGQDHLYDIVTFDSWLEAHHRKDALLTEAFEKRFRPEFAAAYAAWLKTDPFNDPRAPPGPSFMPEYRSARVVKARELAAEAKTHFEQGVATRQTGDEYVRITVVLATVLLLTALAQRFKIHRVRVGLVAIAFVLLAFAMYLISSFPRA